MTQSKKERISITITQRELEILLQAMALHAERIHPSKKDLKDEAFDLLSTLDLENSISKQIEEAIQEIEAK
jgi:hypothetical protein